MAFWRKAKKTPAELVKALETCLRVVTERKEDNEEPDKSVVKAQEKCSRYLQEMILLTRGDAQHEAKPEQASKLVEALLESTVVDQLINCLGKLDFESLSAAVQNIQFALRDPRFEKWLTQRPELVDHLCQCYSADTEFALVCGPLLREALAYLEVARRVLTTPRLFEPFLSYVRHEAFDVAADAFASLRCLLTRHPELVAPFLEQNYDHFFSLYNPLLVSDHYLSKRLALRLLSEMLLSRTNFNIMMLYINDPENLKVVMNLLKEKDQKNIQFEAFHVFKIFVANPNKGAKVAEILARNKHRLIPFLQKFHVDKDDNQFVEEKHILLDTLRQM